MPDRSANDDTLHGFERVHLEKLRLAAEVILELGEDDVIPAPLEVELQLFRDRVQVALLLPESSANVLPWRRTKFPDNPLPEGA